MTIRERAEKFAGIVRSAGSDLDETFLQATFVEAIREEILEVVDDLEASTKRKEEMYAGIGLNGEDQARPFRDIAKEIRKRAEI